MAAAAVALEREVSTRRSSAVLISRSYDGSQDHRCRDERERCDENPCGGSAFGDRWMAQHAADASDQSSSGCVERQHRLQPSQFLELRKRPRATRSRHASTTRSSQQCSLDADLA